MARQKRKPANKPITSHQLFPAVVALWFGALFGLGSLAVRPSLLESAVMASRIDLVIPAAAPPLGVTARILVALILAAIGSAIGLIVARRLTRPKPEVRERKRTKLAEHEEAAPHYTNHPAFAEAEDGEAGGGVLAQRRRALTVEHDEEDFVPHEMAPLPGGAPQILDISKVGFEAPAPHAPLDLGVYQAAPVRQEFQPQPVAPEAVSEVSPVAAPAPAEPVQAEPPRQIFGQAVAGDHIDQSFVQAAGFKTSVFDTEIPQPLFPPRMAQSEPAPEADPVVPQFTVPPAPSVEAFAVPPMAPTAFAVPEPVIEQAIERASAPVAMPEVAPPAPAPVAVGAPFEPLPSPAGLGMTDLASRLAESMARRRAARAAAAGSVGAAPAPVAEAAPVVAAAPVIPAPVMPEPAPVTAPAPQAFSAPVVEPSQPEAPVPAAPIAMPAAMRPLDLALDLGGFEKEAEPLSRLLPPRHIAMPTAPEPAPFAMPQANAPEPEPEPVEDAASEDRAHEESVSEDRFGSLLGVAIQPAGPRAGLVRIEEPEAETAEIEPVVIFPGQMVRPQAEEAAPFRRFDAPSSAEQGQPIAADNSAPAVDREEAERALRMALANLQRMSGAA